MNTLSWAKSADFEIAVGDVFMVKDSRPTLLRAQAEGSEIHRRSHQLFHNTLDTKTCSSSSTLEIFYSHAEGNIKLEETSSWRRHQARGDIKLEKTSSYRRHHDFRFYKLNLQ